MQIFPVTRAHMKLEASVRHLDLVIGVGARLPSVKRSVVNLVGSLSFSVYIGCQAGNYVAGLVVGK